MALNLGANQCTGPSFSAQACFMVAGNITTSMERSPLLVSTKAGGPGQWVVYLFRCLWSSKINQLTVAFPSRRFQSFDNGYISSLLDLLKVVGFSTVGLIFFIESMISITLSFIFVLGLSTADPLWRCHKMNKLKKSTFQSEHCCSNVYIWHQLKEIRKSWSAALKKIQQINIFNLQ